MNRFLFPLLCLLMTLVFGCGHNNEESATTEECDSTLIRVALLPTMDCLPYLVAEECGIYTTLGLNVKLDVFEAAIDADTAFANGHADVLVTDVVKTIVMRSKGDSVCVLHNYEVPLYLLTSQSSRVYNTNNIKEKVVAITRNSWDDMAADRILESVGLASEEMNKPQINSLALRTNMLVNNQYDGALLPEPYAAIAEAGGAKRLCSTSEFGLTAGVAVVDSLGDERMEEMKLFVKAYNIAVDTINNRLANSIDVSGFLPLEQDICDTLLRVSPYKYSSELSDSTYKKAYEWASGRKLVGK